LCCLPLALPKMADVACGGSETTRVEPAAAGVAIDDGESASATHAAVDAAGGAPAPEASGSDGGHRDRPDSVIVKLKAAANAPVLVEKKRKFKLPATQPLTRVVSHIEQLLKEKMQGGNRIFLYVRSVKANFSPSPDQSVGNIYMCFGRETGKGSAILELTYTLTPSWG